MRQGAIRMFSGKDVDWQMIFTAHGEHVARTT
jgi:hypothetical protein